MATHVQVTTAAVRGAVIDEQGSALAGADVSIANVDTGFSRSTKSGADGEYKPFGALNSGSMTYFTRASQSNYHSLQTMFQSRFQRNSTLQIAYTWSKLISDTELIDTPNLNIDYYNPRADRGPDILNHPHIFLANVIYNLPTLQNQSAPIRQALGAWELTSIVSVATGPSMNAIMGSSPIGDPSGTGGGGNEVPMRVAGQGCRANTGDARQWLNPNMYTLNGSRPARLETMALASAWDLATAMWTFLSGRPSSLPSG